MIGRLAQLDPEDVVLEVGPGLGVLTRYLATRVAFVHAVEIDRSLEPAPAGVWPPNVRAQLRRCPPARPRGARSAAGQVRLQPAVQRRDAARRREPRRPAEVESWCVMVQREVADRFFATPRRRPTARSRSSCSSQPSARASTRSRGRCSGRSRTSTRRSSPSAAASCRDRFRSIKHDGQAAFAHRRKTPRPTRSSLPASPMRDRAVAALAAIGRYAVERAPRSLARLSSSRCGGLAR